MRENIKVSIIISTLNSEKTLSDCIQSCLDQNFPNKEIIIIDGKSEDRTINIIKTFSSKSLFYISEKDDGIYDAWNKALSICKGEWICFLGSDDKWISRNSLKRLFENTHNKEVNFISAKVKIVNKYNKFISIMGKRWNYNKLWLNIQIAHPGALHKKTLFDNFGKFNKEFKIAGDHEFLIRAGDSVNANFLDEIIIEMQDGGISKKKPYKAFFESYLAISNNNNFGKIKGIIFLVLSIFKYNFKKII